MSILRLTCDSLATHLRLTLRLTLESGKPDDCYTAVKKPKKPQTIFCFTDPPPLEISRFSFAGSLPKTVYNPQPVDI